MRRLLLAPLAIVLAAGVAACGSDDSSKGDDSGSTGTTQETTAKPAADGCKQVSAPAPKPDGGQKKPTGSLAAGKRYDVTFTTNCGSFTIRVDQKTSPATAASFVSLARKGFFDKTVFHRIVPGFVIQGGDPTGTGQGGPGYSTRDAPPQSTAYTKGVVAMAKTAAEPAGTAGSQFYVVTGADAGLPPDYAVLGKLTEGSAVTEKIDELGDPNSGGAGTPSQPVVISRATVSVK